MIADQISRATFWADALLILGLGVLIFAICTVAIFYRGKNNDQ